MIFQFDPPAKLLSMNDRDHWRKKARLTADWVQAAQIAAHQARVHQKWEPVPSIVTITLPVKGNRRRDPHNFFATVKPIVDGMVLAGIWPDDNSEWVTVTEPSLHVGGAKVMVLVRAR